MERHRYRWPGGTVLVGLFLVLSAAVAVRVAAAPDPRSVVQQTTDEVFSTLRQDRELYKQDPRKLYDLVQARVLPHFDFVTMSKRVLGRFWRQANAEQQQRFTEQFRSLLVRTYSTALVDYTSAKVKVLPLPQPPEGGTALVRTEVAVEGQQPIRIDYAMRLEGDAWKVFDVSIDGVSLVINYRSSFATEIERSGIDGLIGKLVELNARNEPGKPRAGSSGQQ